jgi:hypothetical protein
MSEGKFRVVSTGPGRSAARIANLVRQAAADILPKQYGVLPDGRATHSVIARRAVELAEAEGLVVTKQIGE